MDNLEKKNCSVIITQRTEKGEDTEVFTFDDYRTATALCNLLHNLDPAYYKHTGEHKDYIPVRTNI